MAKPEWGVKRVCNSCSARFYDMMRSPVVCPKCGATVDTELGFKPSRRSSAAVAAAAAEAKASLAAIKVQDPEIELDADELAAVEEEDPELDSIEGGEDEDTALIEDASDLGEDDDDMAEVMEHLDEPLNEDEV